MTKKSNKHLIRQPWYYEYIYPEAGGIAAQACQNIIDEFCPGKGLSMLDIGCGTGKIISHMTGSGHTCAGIDISKPMVDYALLLHPKFDVTQGDMRNFDLNKKFDVVLCVGSTFTSNLSNADVHASLANFHRHCKPGGLLIIALLNASRFLGAETFNEHVEMRVDEEDFHATTFSRHLLDRRNQSFRRVRTWRIDGEDDPVVDDAEFRLFFPLEIEDYLGQHKFSVLGMWDTPELKETDLSDRRLYIAARAL
jgi:SAM-dependent methyltransferase